MKRHKEVLYQVALLLVLCYFSFFYRLGERALTDPDEGRYAVPAREMLVRGDFLTPYFNGEPRLNKPALIYWLIAGSYKLFGINEFAARFPSAVAATGMVLVMFFFCRFMFTPLIALLTGIILALSPHYLVIARISNTDMTLSFFITLSLSCFMTFYIDRKRTFFLFLMYIGIAFATFTKGYVGLIVPLIVIFVFLASLKDLSFIRQTKPLKGLLIFLLINAPWYITVVLTHKELLHYFVVEEGLLRFFTTEHERYEPVWYYPLLLTGTLFPWSFFMLRAFLKQVKGGIKNFAAGEPRHFFIFIWYISILILFSLSSSKLATYVLPLIPALAVSVALWVAANFFLPHDESLARYRESPRTVKTILFIVFLISIGIFLGEGGYVIRKRAHIILAGVGLISFVMSCWWAWRIYEKRPDRSFASLAIGLVLMLAFTPPSLDRILSTRRSTRAFCSRAAHFILPDDTLYSYDKTPPPSTIFYFRRVIPVITTKHGTRELLSNQQDVFFIVEENEEDDFVGVVEGVTTLYKDPELALITNKHTKD